jgi:hypothetical protein
MRCYFIHAARKGFTVSKDSEQRQQEYFQGIESCHRDRVLVTMKRFCSGIIIFGVVLLCLTLAFYCQCSLQIGPQFSFVLLQYADELHNNFPGNPLL